MFNGRNLLDVPAKNSGEYARNLLKILFKQQELQSCLLPSQQAKRYLKSELDHERMKLLNGKKVLSSIIQRIVSVHDYRRHPNALSHRQVPLSLLLQGENTIDFGCVSVQRRSEKIEETNNANRERTDSRGTIDRRPKFNLDGQF
jgi:hypothetical protein